MRKIFLGAPGSGKGTYASRISPKLNIPHISTGTLFRKHMKEKTEIGTKIKKLIETGELIPDEITIEILKNRIKQEDCKKGFILDGFPRTTQQAEELTKISDIDIVINLCVPDEIIIKRLSSRTTCKNCGEIFNTTTLKPKQKGTCDKCQGKTIRRPDDEPEIIQKRLTLYKEQTAPLIDFYKNKGILQNFSCDNLYSSADEMAQKIIELSKNFTKNIIKPIQEITSEP